MRHRLNALLGVLAAAAGEPTFPVLDAAVSRDGRPAAS